MSNPRAAQPPDTAPAEDQVLDSTSSEHIYLASEPEIGTDHAAEPGTVVEKFEIADRRRRLTYELTLYDQGMLRVYQRRGGKRLKSHTVKLRYLDSAPTITRHIAKRSLYAVAGFAGLAIVAGLLAQIELLRTVALFVVLAAVAGAGAAALIFFWRSYERTVFHTLHGRAHAITLTASVGQFARCRAILPKLVRAIEDEDDTIGDDTALYLREEMREHYRLRGDGVLSTDDCSESTERILAQFDSKL